MLIDAYGYENDKSKKLAFMLSRSDIANFAGTSYESVIRNIAKLEELGFVQVVGKGLIISKEKELRKEVNAINKEMKSLGNGIYISAGAAIIIIILLIILL